MSKKKRKEEKIIKTNAMRYLDDLHIDYIPHHYETDITNGSELARTFGIKPEETFKTLVTVSNDHEYIVFMIPVDEKLAMKKAAEAAGVKSVQMILQKDLFPKTGYVHGGCSPLGMKKQFRTFVDQSAADLERIYFSGGKIGVQIEMDPEDLKKLQIEPANLTV